MNSCFNITIIQSRIKDKSRKDLDQDKHFTFIKGIIHYEYMVAMY